MKQRQQNFKNKKVGQLFDQHCDMIGFLFPGLDIQIGFIPNVKEEAV